MKERIGEDLFSLLISSLENLISKASRINRRLLYSIYILLSLAVIEFVLWAFYVISLNLWDIILYGVLLVVTFIVLFALLDIRESLAEVISKYSAYQHMENATFDIPEGKDMVERFLKYLDLQFNFRREIERRGGKIMRNATLNCNGTVTFDLYAEVKSSFFGKLRGEKSYTLFVRIAAKVEMSSIKKFVEDVKKCVSMHSLEIGRAVLLLPSQEISDEVYNYLVEKKSEIPLQVVIEMGDGTYDFIPFIGPRPDMLP